MKKLSFYFLSAVLFVSNSLSVLAQEYDVHLIDYATGPDRIAAHVNDVNNYGALVGWSFENGVIRPFYFDLSLGLLYMPSLAGATAARAIGINDAWQIVGDSNAAGLPSRAVLWDSNTWQITNLFGLPGSSSSVANSINDSGQIVGGSVMGGITKGFLYDTSGMRAIEPVPGARIIGASRINNLGYVTGAYDFEAAPEQFNTYLWHEEGYIATIDPLPGGRANYGARTNDMNQVAGTSRGDGGWGGFIWHETSKILDIGTLGFRFVEVNGLANEGSIVGRCFEGANTVAFVRDSENGMRDLNTLIKDPDWALENATAISRNGSFILGSGQYQGNPALFILVKRE